MTRVLQLLYLDVGGNSLDGTLPSSWGSFSQVSHLYPNALGNISEIGTLVTHSNQRLP